jgi:hypothetical protein
MKCINLARVEILVTFSPGGCSNILKDKKIPFWLVKALFSCFSKSFKSTREATGKNLKHVNVYRKVISRRKNMAKCIALA